MVVRRVIELADRSCRDDELPSVSPMPCVPRASFETLGNRVSASLPAQTDDGLDVKSEILDRSVLEGLRVLEARVGKALLPEMVEIFEFHGSRYCEQIRNAFDVLDVTVLRQTSHKLKGSARTVGLLRLSAACAELEAACTKPERQVAETDWNSASNLVASVEAEYVQATTALHAYLEG